MIDYIVTEELDKAGNVVVTKYKENETTITDVTVIPETDNPIVNLISANTFRGIVGEPVADPDGKTESFEDRAKRWLEDQKWILGIF